MTQMNSSLSSRRNAPVKSNIYTVLVLIAMINLSIGVGYILYRYNELYHSMNIFDFTIPAKPTAAPAGPTAMPTPATPAATPATPAATPATAPAATP